jgi:hypothetical protein
MSAARYGLTMFAGKDGMFDPEKRQPAVCCRSKSHDAVWRAE